MRLIEGLWVFSTIMSNVAVIMMMMSYRKMRISLSQISTLVKELYIRKLGSCNGQVISDTL